MTSAVGGYAFGDSAPAARRLALLADQPALGRRHDRTARWPRRRPGAGHDRLGAAPARLPAHVNAGSLS
jgi:hypothetical protein